MIRFSEVNTKLPFMLASPNPAWLTLLVLLSISFSAYSQILFDADNEQSIDRLRAIPMHLSDEKMPTFMRHSIEDKEGYLWVSGGRDVLRYDGYDLKETNFADVNARNQVGSPFLFLDSDMQFWVGSNPLSLFDYETQTFSSFLVSDRGVISSITEDEEGYLWIAGEGFGFVKYDRTLNQVVSGEAIDIYPNAPKNVQNIVFEKSQNMLWMASTEGVYGFDIGKSHLFKVSTDIDDHFVNFSIRDISVDEKHNALWIGTTKGLLRIDTHSLETKIYKTSTKPNSLPINDVSVTFIDSADNLWLGLEKEGLCLFRHKTEDFICLRSSSDEKNRLPFATIEDISEDSNGSLWFSMNHHGIFRITPDLEKFVTMSDLFSNEVKHYFPNSFDGIFRDNNDLWIATDGGGINIFNTETGIFNNLKSKESDPISLSSNSVISLTQDENGDIWAGTWAGGISKIDPESLSVERFVHQADKPSDQSVMGNNIFVVNSDQKGGIWLSIWNKGLQYYNINEERFTNYLHTRDNGINGLRNSQISHLQLFDNKVWITGEAGLEVLDINTQKFTLELPVKQFKLTYVAVESCEEVWIASFNGFFKFNSITKETSHYTTEQGLSSDQVHYLTKSQNGDIWLATSNGVSVFDPTTETFSNYFARDGLVGNRMSAHGEFLFANNKFYIPGKYGVTIVDPADTPNNKFVPRTVINAVKFITTTEFSKKHANETFNATELNNTDVPYEANSIAFDFSSLSFVYPNHNKYKYRLKGWQRNFTQVSASQRSASFTNLPAGKYTFEVYSSSSSGIWDNNGDKFSFTILPPWWETWWATVLFVVLLLISLWLIINWRLTMNNQREKELQRKVKEKTKQLESYAQDLKIASDSLSKLNAELEDRVEMRTAELQIEVNERKVVESKSFYMAFHDSLTDLPNREWIIQKIEELLAKCQLDKTLSFGVMFLDGDRFKQINDTHGHIFGDQLLVAASQRLESLMGDNQYTGRLGGDEFTVIAESYDEQELEGIAKTIVEAFKMGFCIENIKVYFNVSMGIIQCDYQYTTVLEVLRSADIAMYRAKEAGKATYKLFDQNMQKETLEMAALEGALLNAVNNNDFHLVYQPLIDLDSGRITGFEALIRWHHPEKGLISPLTFIPIAEETGLIWKIGKWVLHEACRQTKLWHDMQLGNLPSISVNLSSNQLQESRFLDMIDQTITEVGIDPKYLKLELTESVLIENNHAMSMIFTGLRERGIDLAIDDFGTGYSSLAYLNEIPVQYLKIDRRFVKALDLNADADINQDALEILKATISLGKSLRKLITAEGIETETQLAALIEHGCDFAQGYLLSKPVSSEIATEILQSKKDLSEGGVNISKQDYALAYKARLSHK